MSAIVFISTMLAVYFVPAALYLGYLTLLSWPRKQAPYGVPLTRFAFVVPAHNEEINIAGTVESLLKVDYPEDFRRVIVVADNCNDRTAARALAAGAEVWQRQHATLRGKGYALEFAFNNILHQNVTDAVVVVDADTVVSKNLLRAFDARIVAGAKALQAEYGVSNPLASWRTRLMTVALAMFHRLRNLARERLNVSVGLRGNGMCFTTQLLRTIPHKAFGLVEDVEYGIALGLAGERIVYAEEASVLGEMVSGGAGAVTQRRRWESGRLALAKAQLPVLARAAVKQKSRILTDLAIDLAVPPLSYLGLGITIGLVLERWIWSQQAGVWGPAVGGWCAAAVALSLYVIRGIFLSNLGMQAVVAMAMAPIYIVWKLLLMRPAKWFGARGNDAWIRTRRESERAQ